MKMTRYASFVVDPKNANFNQQLTLRERSLLVNTLLHALSTGGVGAFTHKETQYVITADKTCQTIGASIQDDN